MAAFLLNPLGGFRWTPAGEKKKEREGSDQVRYLSELQNTPETIPPLPKTRRRMSKQLEQFC